MQEIASYCYDCISSLNISPFSCVFPVLKNVAVNVCLTTVNAKMQCLDNFEEYYINQSFYANISSYVKVQSVSE